MEEQKLPQITAHYRRITANYRRITANCRKLPQIAASRNFIYVLKVMTFTIYNMFFFIKCNKNNKKILKSNIFYQNLSKFIKIYQNLSKLAQLIQELPQ